MPKAPKRSHTADEKGGPAVGHAQKRGRETSGKPYDQPPAHTSTPPRPIQPPAKRGRTGPHGQARADVPASQPEQSGKRGGRGGRGDDGYDGGGAGGDGSEGGDGGDEQATRTYTSYSPPQLSAVEFVPHSFVSEPPHISPTAIVTSQGFRSDNVGQLLLSAGMSCRQMPQLAPAQETRHSGRAGGAHAVGAQPGQHRAHGKD